MRLVNYSVFFSIVYIITQRITRLAKLNASKNKKKVKLFF